MIVNLRFRNAAGTGAMEIFLHKYAYRRAVPQVGISRSTVGNLLDTLPKTA